MKNTLNKPVLIASILLSLAIFYLKIFGIIAICAIAGITDMLFKSNGAFFYICLLMLLVMLPIWIFLFYKLLLTSKIREKNPKFILYLNMFNGGLIIIFSFLFYYLMHFPH